jgi:hypothetical protein
VFVRTRTFNQSAVYHTVKKRDILSKVPFADFGFAADQRLFEFLDTLMHLSTDATPSVPWTRPFETYHDVLSSLRELWHPYDRHKMIAAHSPSLYWFDNERFARSIRLVGATDESFPRSALSIRISNDSYLLPAEWRERRHPIIDHEKKQSKDSNRVFEDGPVMRLMSYRATPQPPHEHKHLDLILGPLGWYDYTVAWKCLEAMLRHHDDVAPFLNLEQLVRAGDLRASRLSNIVDTATTLLTNDGFLIYSHRGGMQSVDAGRLTSAIAENVNPSRDLRSLDPDSTLFNTVLRGLDEEASPELRERVAAEPWRIRMLGLGFELDTFHPDALFLALLPCCLDELYEICRRRPGKDFWEGKLGGVLALGERAELRALLSQDQWVAGGKACVIRSLEYVDAVLRRTGEQSDALAAITESFQADAG